MSANLYGQGMKKSQLFSLSETPISGTRPVYIAVSGNTGAGKSTLVYALARSLTENGIAAVPINERALHHPLLPLMFAEPEKYALGIQLNFVVQRYIALTRWLELGYVVVVERAMTDDPLFVNHYHKNGVISDEEASAYRSITCALSSRLPMPDIHILIDVEPTLSLKRITQDEVSGLRPREFSSEEEKRNYVNGWREQYVHYFDSLLKASCDVATRYVKHNATEMIDGLVCRVTQWVQDTVE